MGESFKELEIILSDFACDKNCPYCTAKITKWQQVEDDIHMLYLNVGQMKELGYTFHYVTIGGNGEPTLHSYNKLKDIVEMFDDWDIPVKRVLTSGNVFRPSERAKYELFVEHGWMFEITVADGDMDVSNRIQGYDWNYMDTDAFKAARVRLNYVLLHQNIKDDKFVSDIEQFSEKYPNIETLALKLLNVNTFDGEPNNPLSRWILENGVPKSDRQVIADILNKRFTYVGEAFDTHSWRMENGSEVYFSWKKVEYGLYDLVWYGNRFVTYQLETVDIGLLPKVYIASRFIKEKTENGYSFARDYRAELIGTERDFVDFNNHSFIRKDGKPVAQYLGPFYNEKASDGSLTSTACEEVVNTENRLIERCDIFVCYFDETLSPGSINELTYAVLLKKKIVIIYKVEPDVGYDTQTSSWYPITFAKLLSDDCVILPLKEGEDIKKVMAGAITNV